MPTENTDEVLAYLQEQAEAALEPGGQSSVVSTGEGAPPMVGHTTSAGYVYVYDRRTGVRSIVNRNQVLGMNGVLSWKDKGGTFIYTLTDPGFRPDKGAFRCRLHTEDEGRPTWDSFGLPVCNKEGIPNEYMQMRHMALKHNDELQVIFDFEAREEKVEKDAVADEDRAFQRKLMEQLAARST